MGPVARASVAKRGCGYAPAMFGRWKKKDKHHADKQQGDPGALEREGDPRGGLQDEAYRKAEATDVVEAEGVAMSGPGGAPQEGMSADERRDANR
jgi:hypothetical protein